MGVTATLAVLAVGSACTATATQVEEGGECFVATDCMPGLVCIEQANKTRICSDDLARVAGEPPPAAGTVKEPDAGDGGDAGEVFDASLEDVMPDTGARDASPPPDAGAPPDASGDAGGSS